MNGLVEPHLQMHVEDDFVDCTFFFRFTVLNVSSLYYVGTYFKTSFTLTRKLPTSRHILIIYS